MSQLPWPIDWANASLGLAPISIAQILTGRLIERLSDVVAALVVVDGCSLLLLPQLLLLLSSLSHSLNLLLMTWPTNACSALLCTVPAVQLIISLFWHSAPLKLCIRTVAVTGYSNCSRDSGRLPSIEWDTHSRFANPLTAANNRSQFVWPSNWDFDFVTSTTTWIISFVLIAAYNRRNSEIPERPREREKGL